MILARVDFVHAITHARTILGQAPFGIGITAFPFSPPSLILKKGAGGDVSNSHLQLAAVPSNKMKETF